MAPNTLLLQHSWHGASKFLNTSYITSQYFSFPSIPFLSTLLVRTNLGNFFPVSQIERDNSFYNMAEAHFTVKLIQSLIASGIEGAAIGVITLYKSQMYKVCIINQQQ